MYCTSCDEDKRSIEFPQTTITDACEHIATECLRVSIYKIRIEDVIIAFLYWNQHSKHILLKQCLISKLVKQGGSKKGPSLLDMGRLGEGCRCPECHNPLSKEERSRIMDAAYDSVFVLNTSKFDLVTKTAPQPYPSFSKLDSAASSSASAKAPEPSFNWEFYVVFLTGERFAFQCKDHRSLQTLKMELEKMTNVEIGKQKLIFEGITLDVRFNCKPLVIMTICTSN